MQFHNVDPTYDQNSTILILGSFPSVKSREAAFPYSHAQNRFWPLMARLLKCPLPEDRSQRRQMLLDNGIALWDVIASCHIQGSADASITQVTPNMLTPIIQGSKISRIFTNGETADKLYRRHCLPETGIPARKLPSTSPANARMRLDDLMLVWQVIVEEPHACQGEIEQPACQD